MKNYIVTIHNDIDKETYTYFVEATNIFAAENKAVAEHFHAGLDLTRVETREVV